MLSGFWVKRVILTISVYCNVIWSQEVSPLLDLCDDGLVDTAVRANDGKIYIFKGDYYFEFSLEKTSPLLPARPIKDWTNLPQGIHASVTVTDNTNDFFGNTFFFKEDKWFQYLGKNFVASNSTQRWIIDPIHARYIIPMYNESIYGFFSLASPRVVFGQTSIFNWYNFRHPNNPDLISSGSLDTDFGIDLYSVRAIVDYSYNEWLVFFEDGPNGYFCILKGLNGHCTEKYIWDSSVCPDQIKYFYEDSVLLMALDRLPFNLERLFAIVFAILCAAFVILLVLTIGLTAIIIDFIKIKNRSKLFQLLLERQKQPNKPYISFGKYLLRTIEKTINGPNNVTG